METSRLTPPKKFRVQASADKVLYAMFWDRHGSIFTYPVPKGTTVTGKACANVLKTGLIPAIAQSRPHLANGFILHQDNAPPHRALLVKDVLKDHNIEVLPHPPYSPDLAPSDFWLFPKMKDELRGRHFPSRAALGSAIFQYGKCAAEDFFWMLTDNGCTDGTSAS